MGCELENTVWANNVLATSSALGWVIYTGHKKRSMRNTFKPRTFEKELDYFIVWLGIPSGLVSLVFNLLIIKI